VWGIIYRSQRPVVGQPQGQTVLNTPSCGVSFETIEVYYTSFCIATALRNIVTALLGTVLTSKHTTGR
jgi:hypothetical protein